MKSENDSGLEPGTNVLDLVEISNFRRQIEKADDPEKSPNDILDEINVLLDVARAATDRALAASRCYLKISGIPVVDRELRTQAGRELAEHIPSQDKIDAERWRYFRKMWAENAGPDGTFYFDTAAASVDLDDQDSIDFAIDAMIARSAAGDE